jgi:hypothetical protein
MHVSSPTATVAYTSRVYGRRPGATNVPFTLMS